MSDSRPSHRYFTDMYGDRVVGTPGGDRLVAAEGGQVIDVAEDGAICSCKEALKQQLVLSSFLDLFCGIFEKFQILNS